MRSCPQPFPGPPCPRGTFEALLLHTKLLPGLRAASAGSMDQAAPLGLTNRRDLLGSNFHTSLLQKAFLKPRRGGRLLWAPGAASLQLSLLGYNSTQDPAVIPLCPGQLLGAGGLSTTPYTSAQDGPGLHPCTPNCPPYRADALGLALAPRGASCLGVNTNLPQDQRLRALQHLQGEEDRAG